MSIRIVLKDQIITSFEDFGRIMYKFPDEAEKLIVSKKFLIALNSEDPTLFKKIVKLNHEVRNREEFLFYAQYLFCPHQELKHHGYSFKNLKELGMQILKFGPEIDVYLKDFVAYKFISYYMEHSGLDKSKPKIYHKIVELENTFNKFPNKNYFLVGFVLSECDKIIYEGKEYSSIEEFFKDMVSDYHIARYSSKLSKNQYVYAWLSIRGHEDIVNRVEGLTKTVEQLEVIL